MEIKALDVKKLREKTGAGMMDCKKALLEAEGDFKKAEKILKELGLAAAAKRGGRATKEGQIFSVIKDGKGVLLELSCETDFVAKNKEFVRLGEELSNLILEKENIGKESPEIDEKIKEAIGRIKENIELKRFKRLKADEKQFLVNYIHRAGDIGKIGVLLLFEVEDPSLKDNPRLKEVAFDMALHTAAYAPLFLSRDKVNPDYLKEQEEIFLKQAQNLGKPEKVLQGIVKGKINKHLSEICLMDQMFVKDQKLKVSQVLENLGKELNSRVNIADFLYFRLGEE